MLELGAPQALLRQKNIMPSTLPSIDCKLVSSTRSEGADKEPECRIKPKWVSQKWAAYQSGKGTFLFQNRHQPRTRNSKVAHVKNKSTSGERTPPMRISSMKMVNKALPGNPA